MSVGVRSLGCEYTKIFLETDDGELLCFGEIIIEYVYTELKSQGL